MMVNLDRVVSCRQRAVTWAAQTASSTDVGFLLRVTDVERQSFRSMGFVSVIIVSGLFALGLPLVLV